MTKEEEGKIVRPVKCTTQPAPIAAKRPRYLLNLMENGRYIAGIVLASAGPQDIDEDCLGSYKLQSE